MDLFEVKLKSALRVEIELQLNLHMRMYLLVNKGAQSKSMKGKLEISLNVTLGVEPKIHFVEHLKLLRKVKKKIHST